MIAKFSHREHHINRWANLLLILAVTATLFLAVAALLTNLIPDMDQTVALAVSGAVGPAVMVALLFFTSMGRGVKESFFKGASKQDAKGEQI